jgi:hypothetical protein
MKLSILCPVTKAKTEGDEGMITQSHPRPLIEFMAERPDFQRRCGKRHPLTAILTFGLLALVLTSCLGYPDVPESVRQAHSNELDEILGQVELLVPAERKARPSVMTPNGRWLLESFGSSGTNWKLFTLADGAEQPTDTSDCRPSTARWLEPNQAVLAQPHECYYLVLVTAEDVETVKLPIVL